MFTTESLTESQWLTVYAMAEMLVNEKSDVNELSKTIAYLRAYGHQENAEAKFFQYLKILVRDGKSIGHSKQTPEYYKSIEKACKQHLQKYQYDVEAMLQILGWVARMMRYYKSGGSIEVVSTKAAPAILGHCPAMAGNEGSIEVVSTKAAPTRQAEIAQTSRSQELKIGDILEATITNIKGFKVTYTILESKKLTEKEPKKASSLSVGQKVKVRITEMKDAGEPKKLQLLD